MVDRMNTYIDQVGFNTAVSGNTYTYLHPSIGTLIGGAVADDKVSYILAKEIEVDHSLYHNGS